MSWLFAAAIDDIPARGARVLLVGDDSIALFRTGDGRIFALRDRCPHRGGPLSQGIVHGHCVTCPLHDWVIDLATGEAVGPDAGATASFDVRVTDGQVYIELPPSATSGGQGRSDEPGRAGADTATDARRRAATAG